MRVRTKLRKGAEAYLVPGERIQAVFMAERLNLHANAGAVIATDRRLMLLKVNYFGAPTGFLAEVDRHTELGPCRGFLQSFDTFGTKLAVRKQFFPDVLAADRAAGFSNENSDRPPFWSRIDVASVALLIGAALMIAIDLLIAVAQGVTMPNISFWWYILPNIAAVPLAVWAAGVGLRAFEHPVRTPVRWIVYFVVGLATVYAAFFSLPMEAIALFRVWMLPNPSVSRAHFGR